MGKSTLACRRRLKAKVVGGGTFVGALLRREREAFDSLVDHIFRYVRVGVMYPERSPSIYSSCRGPLSHEEKIHLLERELKLEMGVDGGAGAGDHLHNHRSRGSIKGHANPTNRDRII